jgi:hypothetical protein
MLGGRDMGDSVSWLLLSALLGRPCRSHYERIVNSSAGQATSHIERKGRDGWGHIRRIVFLPTTFFGFRGKPDSVSHIDE